MGAGSGLMSKSILFLSALIALPVALLAFVLSGRRSRGAAPPGRGDEHLTPTPAPVPPTPETGTPTAPEVASERIWARLARQVAGDGLSGKA